MHRILILLAAAVAAAQTRIPVVVPPNAPAEQRLAAAELSRYLARIYSGHEFPVQAQAPASARRILLETRKMARPESFAVSRRGQTATIAGADGRGVLYGVYALLEKLGCGFYLSFDALPAPKKSFSFDEWHLEDAPLYGDRVVFNWHNFLSSGSAWDLPDWQRWIDGSARMRFNTIMVHAYGNNPMFSFRFNGKEKPIGYLATTVRGRDWGTQHVNDVRRLIGGEVFRESVFGSGPAKAPEERRGPEATALMQRVFQYARSRGMHITFALDVDTEPANPQELIMTLPASARITQGKLQLANPDTPEGYAFYREQARQLLATYPEIDRLAVWFRDGRTPWRDLQLKEFPPAWQKEYEELSSREPDLAGNKLGPGIFAVSKLVRTFGRALRDVGRGDVKLATGSWRLAFLHTADICMPKEAAFIPLDWSTEFDTGGAQQLFRAIRPGRHVVPIVWAHHDDRTYIGRSYTPYKDFANLLESSRAAGFGIIHWTTRPLDLYFKSHATQVWSASRNEPLAVTCRHMAARAFGPAAEQTGGEYLLRWVADAPQFGRETSNRFMDTPLKEPVAAMAAMRARLDLLARVDAAPEGRENLAYFRDYERFMLAFFESHTAWERAGGLLKKGSLEEARREMAACRPEEVIRLYVQAARHGAISRGEEALIVSLNLRWLPYMLSLRQALAMEPLRIKLAPTQHEPLAQGAGANTFFVDEERRLWRVMGEKETGAPVSPAGLRIDAPVTLRVAPLGGEKMAAGSYVLELHFASSPDAVEIGATGLQPVQGRPEAGPTRRYPIDFRGGALDIKLAPRQSGAVLASAVLTPAR